MMRIFSTSVIFLFIILAMPFYVAAQCPGCQIDSSQIGPSNSPNGGISPDTLPPAVANKSYSSDVTFFIPLEMNSQFGQATVTELEIQKMVGLPLGLKWECDNAANGCVYKPQTNPRKSQYGCVRVCGTPLVAPGFYPITVIGEGTGEISGISRTQEVTFNSGIRILPDTSSAGSCDFAPQAGCAPLDVSFETNFPSNGRPGFSYSWDFGNGLQSNVEKPGIQTYQQPGTYEFVCNTTIDTSSIFSLQSVTISSASGFSGGVCDNNSGDFYFEITNSNGYSFKSSTKDNSNPPVTWNTSESLDSLTYTIQVKEEDDFPCGGDDDLGTATFSGSQSGTIILTTSGGSGNATVELTIQHPILEISDTSTIEVFENPKLDSIENLTGTDTICQGDTVTLSTSTNAPFINWFQNDTTLLTSATDTFVKVTADSAYYSIRVSDSNGCSKQAPQKYVQVDQKPPKPILAYNKSKNQLLAINPEDWNTIWYLDGDTLASADTASDLLEPSVNGVYEVQYVKHGCSSALSDTAKVKLPTGIDDRTDARGFDVYPNPTENRVTISLEKPVTNRVNVFVLNVVGEKVINQQMETGDTRLNIDLSDYAEGVYFIRLEGEQQVRTEQVILQKP